jgi:pimeloyl-ACP methyl ester carboxylesterase
MTQHNTFLLLHGALGSHKQFNTITQSLPFKFAPSYDFPGHGELSGILINNLDMEQLAHHLRFFIESKRLIGCKALGHSMGGYIAALTESLYPGTFSGICTIGTKWFWNSEIAEKEVSKLSLQNLMQYAPEFVARLQTYHGDKNLNILCDSVINLLNKIAYQPPLSGLKNVKCPIMIVRGENDPFITKEESEFYHNSHHDSKYLELPNTRHAFEEIQIPDIEMLLQKLDKLN